jgi:hypothetical protein
MGDSFIHAGRPLAAIGLNPFSDIRRVSGEGASDSYDEVRQDTHVGRPASTIATIAIRL